MDGMERLDRRVQTMLARTGEGSRRLAQRLIEAGDVSVNGVIVRRVSTPVRPDARIELAARPAPPPKALVDVTILFEGEGLLAIDKPAGLPSHTTPDPKRDHAEAAVRRLRPDGPLVLLHRLDADTSGVLLFATDSEVAARTQRAFESRAVDKRYDALVQGTLPGETFERHSFLTRDGRVRSEVRSGGDAAHTSFAVLARNDERTLLEAHPHTGRTHQIRVHLAALGLPIVGDRLYGGAEDERLRLHARRLQIGDLVLEAPTPPGFEP
ncbi:MAG: RluA family pseudouridine synthase [Sandaracinus sp.]|nr:RluA family pseudouridine synthase [Sandaracinus sp.]